MLKTAMIFIFVFSSLATVIMVAQEVYADHKAKEAAERAARKRDMISRKERLKKELIAHNREQLALEYLNSGVDNK